VSGALGRSRETGRAYRRARRRESLYTGERKHSRSPLCSQTCAKVCGPGFRDA